MKSIFPDPILDLPLADIPLKGITAHLSQGANNQIVFVEYSDDVDIPEHAHSSQFGVVLKGRIEFTVDGVKTAYEKGDRYFIPNGVNHSVKIYAGYAEITLFDEKDRYKVK